MSRKKNRSQGTATTEKPASPPREVTLVAEASSPKTTPATQSAIPLFLTRVMRSLGSLQMAVLLLSSAVVVLFLGSWLESKFDAKISQEFVYRTWWFTLLLFAFAINIFFAAAKKWPWKRHQTGFLITHVGLLTMLAGGILNSIAGVDAEMDLLDSPLSEVQNEVKLQQQTRQIMYRDQGMFIVERYKKVWRVKDGQPVAEGSERLSAQNYPFNPGVVTWGDANFASQGPFFLRFLNFLAHPITPSWSQKLEDGTTLTVRAYYPHASRELYTPVKEGDGFPAVKIMLARETLGFRGHWLALDPQDEESGQASMGPARVELIGVFPDALIPEFLEPPAPHELGANGQLVIRVGDVRTTFDVAQHLGKTVPVGKTGWQLTLMKYQAAFGSSAATAENPAITFVLTSPKGDAARHRLVARSQPGLWRLDPRKEGETEPDPACWYNPPDFRFGQPEDRLKGLLQLVQSASGKLYFRTFTNRITFQLEDAGEVETEQVYKIWKAMDFQLKVVEHLAQAEKKVRYVPSHERPALRREDLFAVFQCRCEGTSTVIHGGEKKQENLKREFPLAVPTAQVSSQAEKIRTRLEFLTDDLFVEEFYQVRYTLQTEDLGFEIKLLRAESQVDPGTDRDATYTSFVQLTDPPSDQTERAEQGPRTLGDRIAWLLGDRPPPPGEQIRKDVMITMNQPLDYRGYKLYQSNFQRLGDDSRGRPVHQSGLTVGRDPGLWLKYLGSTMLALGITCMFYMRAYFFKPKGRKPA